MADFPDLAAAPADSDPLHERRRSALLLRRCILGAPFRFESDSEELLDMVEAAYGGLPQYQLPADANEFSVDLRLVERPVCRRHADRSPARMQSGSGLLCGVMDESNYLAVAPDSRRALVVVSRDRIAHSSFVRHELIEFAVYLLAARGLGLAPLHGACVGRNGRGVLILGNRGAGKSTLCLHALTSGLELAAEDAVFVRPQGLLAVGVPSFLHLRADTLRFVDADLRQRIRDAPLVERRNGEKKFELDLRKLPVVLATQPFRIVAAVFATSLAAEGAKAVLHSLPSLETASRLRRDQPYAAHQPVWNQFDAAMSRLGAFELRRGRHPVDSIRVIERLLDEDA